MLVLTSLLARYSDSRAVARRKAPDARSARRKLPDRDVCREELMLMYEPLMLSCFDYAPGPAGTLSRGA
jgi:hypothetical protein